MPEIERDGSEAIGLLSVFAATVAGICGLAVGGPLGAIAPAAIAGGATYGSIEPLTRPEPKRLAPPRRSLPPRPALPAPPPSPPALSDAEFEQQHGAPRVIWNESDVPKPDFGYYYGPVTWVNFSDGECITWSFFQAIGHATPSLVRSFGAGFFDQERAQAVCDSVRMIAARKFQIDANEAFIAKGGMALYYRELEARQKRERAEQQRAEAAEAKARLERELSQHDTWMREMREDRDRVLRGIRAGREASLQDWLLKPDFNLQVSGLDERRKTLEEIEAQVADAQVTYRKQLAEREAQEVRWKAEREARQVRMKRLEGPIPLASRDDGRIIFGTAVEDGVDRTWLPKDIQHMLVGGSPGSGKSVFLHQLVHQLLESPAVDRVVLIDLKGGTELERYSDHPKSWVVWEISEVIGVFDELVALLDRRQKEIRSKRLRDWPGGRVFVVIDEYAEIHDSINEARRGEEKERMQRLSNNLKRIIRRARSLGVVMICALQKPTIDAMDSTLRANMNMRVCFRVKTRQAAEAALDAYEDELPANPLQLSKGRFVFDDGQGQYHYLQAQVAPGAVTSDAEAESERTRTASTAA